MTVAKSKIKGGGTTKVCLPKSKVDKMSPEEKQRVISAKKSAASGGKYKRSSSCDRDWETFYLLLI